jgi:hypothetical protein
LYLRRNKFRQLRWKLNLLCCSLLWLTKNWKNARSQLPAGNVADFDFVELFSALCHSLFFRLKFSEILVSQDSFNFAPWGEMWPPPMVKLAPRGELWSYPLRVKTFCLPLRFSEQYAESVQPWGWAKGWTFPLCRMKISPLGSNLTLRRKYMLLKNPVRPVPPDRRVRRRRPVRRRAKGLAGDSRLPAHLAAGRRLEMKVYLHDKWKPCGLMPRDAVRHNWKKILSFFLFCCLLCWVKAVTRQPESARCGFLLYVGSYILAIKLG